VLKPSDQEADRNLPCKDSEQDWPHDIHVMADRMQKSAVYRSCRDRSTAAAGKTGEAAGDPTERRDPPGLIRPLLAVMKRLAAFIPRQAIHAVSQGVQPRFWRPGTTLGEGAHLLMESPRHDDLHEGPVRWHIRATEGFLYPRQARQPLLWRQPSEPPLHLQQRQFLCSAQHWRARPSPQANAIGRLRRAVPRPTSTPWIASVGLSPDAATPHLPRRHAAIWRVLTVRQAPVLVTVVAIW
jgi:hypothetical protein